MKTRVECLKEWLKDLSNKRPIEVTLYGDTEY